MILTDIELMAEIQARRLIFDPPLILDHPDRQLQTSTIDLRLGHELREFVKPPTGIVAAIDPTIPGFDIADVIQSLSRHIAIHEDEYGRYYDLEPNKPVLAPTLERITIPPHLSAWVEGRSSLARLGLTVHNTAPYIHPGYSDYITLEIHYTGPVPFRMRLGRLRICQLIVERVSTLPLEPYPGPYRQG